MVINMRRYISYLLIVLILSLIGCSSGTSGKRIYSKSYIGNKKSHIFHYYDCKWAQKISSKNVVKIKNRRDAINVYHMRPCKSCKP